jgi:hypothetical protein
MVMTDDLRPKSHLIAVLTTAVTVGGGVWGGTQWLNNRASTDDVKALTNNSFQQRLDMEVFKGELRAINIRLERIEKATDTQKQDANENRRRR